MAAIEIGGGSGGGGPGEIAPGSITPDKLAPVAPARILGNSEGQSTNPKPLTPGEVKQVLQLQQSDIPGLTNALNGKQQTLSAAADNVTLGSVVHTINVVGGTVTLINGVLTIDLTSIPTNPGETSEYADDYADDYA